MAERDYYSKEEVQQLIAQAKEELMADLVAKMEQLIEENHSDISYEIIDE